MSLWSSLHLRTEGPTPLLPVAQAGAEQVAVGSRTPWIWTSGAELLVRVLPRPWTLTSRAREAASCSPGGTAPSSLVESQRHLLMVKSRVSGFRVGFFRIERLVMWKKSPWAEGFIFSTFPRRFYGLRRASRRCWMPSSFPGDRWLAVPAGWYHGDGVSQWLACAASVKSPEIRCL